MNISRWENVILFYNEIIETTYACALGILRHIQTDQRFKFLMGFEVATRYCDEYERRAQNENSNIEIQFNHEPNVPLCP